MFDGLKKKLGRFSEDVEEDVDEEAVEAVDEEAVDDDAAQAVAEAESADDEPAATEQADGTEPSAAVDTDPDEGPTADESGTSIDTGAISEADDESGASDDEATNPEADEREEPSATAADPSADEVADTSATETEPEPDDDTEAVADVEEDDAGDGRGLAEKAKLFATGKTVIDEDDLQKHLDDLELALLQSDVEMGVAQEILDGVKANLTGETRRRLSSTGNLVRDALREALYDVISVGQFDFDERVAVADTPMVIIFTGVNGVGKTTSIAKLSQYLDDRGFSSVLANGDTYRAGANEQLQKHAENLDRKCISHQQGSDPAAVIYDAVEYAEAHDVDVVLGDTAGRLHTNEGLMDQLEKIDRVIGPDMTLFVDEAVAGQDAVNRAREFDEAAEIDGSILTKADADPQGGAAISIAHVTGKPILFLGTGQDYDDLDRFDPEEIVDSLLAEE